MMSGFLPDTNIPSELTRETPHLQVERWLDEANDEDLYFSAISLGEILKRTTILPCRQTPGGVTELARWDFEALVWQPHPSGYRSDCGITGRSLG